LLTFFQTHSTFTMLSIVLFLLKTKKPISLELSSRFNNAANDAVNSFVDAQLLMAQRKLEQAECPTDKPHFL
jgi:hypothetical protein